ncbi:unnamed protein product, partial [Rotaria sp. Silwood2]
FALIRAGQYCTSFEDFNHERLYIELTFLANGYSLDFIEYHFAQFLTKFNSTPPHTPFNLNHLTYVTLRHNLFRSIEQEKRHIIEIQQLQKRHHLIELNYLFDWGSRCEFKRQFHEFCSQILEQDPIFKTYGLKIRLNSKHCYSSNTLFARPTKI